MSSKPGIERPALAGRAFGVYSRDMPRLRLMPLIAVAVAFLGFLYVIGPDLASAVLGVLLAIATALGTLKLNKQLNERDTAYRLADDADLQHAAWKTGNDRLAYFGHYQPITWEPLIREQRQGPRG